MQQAIILMWRIIRMIPQLEMSSTYPEYVSGSGSDLNDNPLQNDEIDSETAKE